MTRALIMAGGADAKWAEHGGTGRRQLQLVAGETVLGRQVRQLWERDVQDIYVIGSAALEAVPLPYPTRRISPEHVEWGHEATNGQRFWSTLSRTIQVYGDTVFSERAMDVVAGFRPRRFQAFGRHGPGGVSPYGELFAISFWPGQRQAWAKALAAVFALKAHGTIGRAGSWEAYRFMAGARGRMVRAHRLYRQSFTDITDGTDDFDNPAEYAALLELVAAAPGRF